MRYGVVIHVEILEDGGFEVTGYVDGDRVIQLLSERETVGNSSCLPVRVNDAKLYLDCYTRVFNIYDVCMQRVKNGITTARIHMENNSMLTSEDRKYLTQVLGLDTPNFDDIHVGDVVAIQVLKSNIVNAAGTYSMTVTKEDDHSFAVYNGFEDWWFYRKGKFAGLPYSGEARVIRKEVI